MQAEQDYYKILGVEPTANAKTINDAYRKLAFQYHPDRNQGNPQANVKMLEINTAYAVLSNPAKRKEYDTPLGYRTLEPRFHTGSKVVVNAHSGSPYRNHSGVVTQEPSKDAFRFWYVVKFESKGFSTTSKFAEEELTEEP
jgi:DnaJ-class molecular chaperone